MSASTRKDINFLSISGNGQWTLNAGSDSPTVVENPEEYFAELAKNRPDYASNLKVSGAAAFSRRGLRIGQGAECSVDINNRAVANLEGEFGSPSFCGDQIFSVKGKCHAVISGTIAGRGARLKADILVDNWSDQDYDGSIVDLNDLAHADGKPVNVVLRYGASKVALGKNCKVLVWESIQLTAYWWVKWAVRKALRIPVGKRGPSWI